MLPSKQTKMRMVFLKRSSQSIDHILNVQRIKWTQVGCRNMSAVLPCIAYQQKGFSFIQKNYQLNRCKYCYVNKFRYLSVFNEPRHLDGHNNPKFSKSLLNRNIFPGLAISNTRSFSQASWAYYTSTEFAPVRVASDYIISVHHYTGLPWWATIILSTILLRTCLTLPLFIVSQRNMARYAAVNQEMGEVAKTLRGEVFHYSRKHNLTQNESKMLLARNVRKQLKKKIEEHNCHPARGTLVVAVQFPAWIFMSYGIRNLCGFTISRRDDPTSIYEGFTSGGGILWLTDLTIPDPFFILPVMIGISNLLLTEMHLLSLQSKLEAEPLPMKLMKFFFRFVSIYLMYISSMLPSGLCVYWCTSSLYGVVQYMVIQQPKVRRALRIPKVNNESEKPMTDIIRMAKKKYLRIKD
ncbi:cytochrome c oxidase assembly protein COX18, mitochondrial-like isoform X1 [Mytilus edulis]|uniref:cytochrome c oxidase assembly protein COX18, mitochondrial-like isoform X1 n=2 Tax=Mytilus edulis TaxID=6550 RepID=UPI0039EF7FAC